MKHGLQKLAQDIKVVELVTDAFTSVKALLGMYNSLVYSKLLLTNITYLFTPSNVTML